MSPQSPAENEARRVFAQREAQVSINDKATEDHEKQREAQEAVNDKHDMDRVKEANTRVQEANHRVVSNDHQRVESDKHRLQREKEGKLDLGPSPAPDARYDDKKRLQEINDRVNQENERVARADIERERKDRESRHRERILQERVASRITPSPAPGNLADGGKPHDTQCKSLDGTPTRTKWCQNSCNNYPPMCPDTICVCEDAGRAADLTPAEPAPSPVKVAVQPAAPTNSPAVQSAAPTNSPAVQSAAPSAPTEPSAVTADRVAKRNAEIQKAEQARRAAEHSRKVLEAENRKALEAESRKEVEQRRDALEAEQKQRTDEMSRGARERRRNG
jgi:hypothetical protein